MILINLGKRFVRIPEPYMEGSYPVFRDGSKVNLNHVIKDYQRLEFFPKDKCVSIITRIFQIMIEELAQKKPVNIDGFGLFCVYRYMGLSPTYGVFFRPHMRLRAHFNPRHREYFENAVRLNRNKKENITDFSLFAEPKKRKKPFIREKTKRKTHVKVIDIDIKRIVERLEDINERKYSADWRRKYRGEDR